MRDTILGAIAMASAIAALFFLRFWRETRDRLFAFFALAFFILALSRIGLVQFYDPSEKGEAMYWVRFLAFALILLAIWDKNRTQEKRPM